MAGQQGVEDAAREDHDARVGQRERDVPVHDPGRQEGPRRKDSGATPVRQVVPNLVGADCPRHVTPRLPDVAVRLPDPGAQVVAMYQDLVRGHLRVLWERGEGAVRLRLRVPETIGILDEERLASSLELVVEVAPGGAPAPAHIQELAAIAAGDSLRVRVPASERPELRGLDDVVDVVGQQVADLVVMDVHAWRDRDLPFRRDAMDPETRPPARAALPRVARHSGQQRLAEVYLIAGRHQSREAPVEALV